MIMPGWLCIGCALRPVEIRWTYCHICRGRLERGETVEQDDLLSQADDRHLTAKLNSLGLRKSWRDTW